MNRRQVAALLGCSLISWWVGSALMPLLPLYVQQLGAAPALVGNYLAFVFLSLVIGTVGAGWLANRLQHRRALIIGISLLAAPATWGMGQVKQLWQLALLNAVTWMAGGAALALVSILAGMYAAKGERGRLFGWLALTMALASVVGGLTAGPLVDGAGYPMLFTILAGLWLLQAFCACFLPDRPVAQGAPHLQQSTRANVQPQFSRAYTALVVASFCLSLGNFVAILGRSLAMAAQGYSASSITITVGISAGVTLVMNPLMGRLSDRHNRWVLLALIYAAAALGVAWLAVAASPLDFLAASILLALVSTERAVGSALATDLLPPNLLDRGLSRFEAAKWIGAVLGLAGAGYAVQWVGLPATLLLGAAFPLVAIGALVWVAQKTRKDTVTAQPANLTAPDDPAQGRPVIAQ
ncbi:MAG: MFS transporter [Caldilineaceae bacterium]|nr:MFS transporter [Caldilineaceae bacterium]